MTVPTDVAPKYPTMNLISTLGMIVSTSEFSAIDVATSWDQEPSLSSTTSHMTVKATDTRRVRGVNTVAEIMTPSNCTQVSSAITIVAPT